VKVCHFSLQGDVTLPKDFRQTHESPWITPPNREFAKPELRSRMFNEVLDELELSSKLGFDGGCVNEHHSSLYAVTPCPNLYGAALARATKDSAILVLGNALPSRGNPVRLAEEYAFIDCLSEGRLVAGLPLGASMDVNHVYGVTPSETRARFREGVDLMLKAWSEPGPFAYNGRFNKLRHVNPDPLPYQQPRPPVWLLGAESKDTWEFAVQNDFAYGFFSFFGYEYGEAGLRDYWDTVEEYGKDLNPYRVAFLQMICVSETDEQTEADYADHVFTLFDQFLTTPPYFFDPPGYKLESSLFRSNSGTERLQKALAANDPTLPRAERWRKMVDAGFVIAGSAATVRDRLSDMCKRLNVGHLLALFQMGSLPHEAAMKNITLFAEGVLPYVQPIHDDAGWEDHWWPTGARRATTAAVPA
jgi:alkanesulfonate monooxygenase SsuD/methylene tetrahydromethanopterin reductase-like flavin-dependent oxidoreductase (luciferase family)